MAICNCSLAGTEACKNCLKHISFGEQIIGFTSRGKFYEVESKPIKEIIEQLFIVHDNRHLNDYENGWNGALDKLLDVIDTTMRGEE